MYEIIMSIQKNMQKNMQKRRWIFGIFLVILLFGTGAFFLKQKTETNNEPLNKISVVASFYPYAYFAQQIGGEFVDVVNLTPAGSEPHDYELSPKDIIAIERSRLLILNGGGLEAWGENIKQNLHSKNTRVFEVGELLMNQQLQENGKSIPDTHIWLSPKLAKEIVTSIASQFFQIDPSNKEYYQKNVDTLKSQLTSLDLEYEESLSQCRQMNIITSHAAFGYLAAAYGLTQVPIAGLSPDEEPAPKQLSEIIQFARKNQIQYIFFENLVSPKFSEMIANELGAKTLVLDPLEGLTQEEINAGENYFTTMKQNLDHLKIALECQ